MAFTPRLNDNGILGNLHWYSNDNPYYATGFGMPNCTAYAWGRFWEIGDPTSAGIHKPNPNELPGYWSGGYWWREVDTSVYQTGGTPALGAVICFEDTSGGDGHVAIVEQIINGGESIVTSNSAYNSTYFFTQTLYRSNNYCWTGINGHFYRTQGFIYNPYGDSPTPPVPTSKKSKFPWFIYTNKNNEGF
jgi:surface antigen